MNYYNSSFVQYLDSLTLLLNVNTPLSIIYEQLSEINKVLQELMTQFVTVLPCTHICKPQ